MSEDKTYRLRQVASTLSVGTVTVVEFLSSKGHPVENNPNSKISQEQFDLLTKAFQSSLKDKKDASGVKLGNKRQENMTINTPNTHTHHVTPPKEEEKDIFIQNVSAKADNPISAVEDDKVKLRGLNVVGKIDLQPKKFTKSPLDEYKRVPFPKKDNHNSNTAKNTNTVPPVKEPVIEKVVKEIEKTPTAKIENQQIITSKEEVKKPEEKPAVEVVTPVAVSDSTTTSSETSAVVIEAKADQLKGLTVLGKIDIPKDNKNIRNEMISDKEKEREREKDKRKKT